MKVYKFGGASVKDARGIRNLAEIVKNEPDDLVIVVSAIGKTTNALEQVAATHHEILDDLELPDFDRVYDAFVSQGELQSTHIVSAYLNANRVPNIWLDATKIVVTDATHRAAVVNMDATRERFTAAIRHYPAHRYVIQGFIGGTESGEVTTLGREGSDYSAAIFAAAIGAQSVTIWKDVPGVLTADPRRHSDAQLIPEMSYDDAIRLTQSGAQIIHPKTIQPLQEHAIPLYVKPFMQPNEAGTIIHQTSKILTIPVLWGK